ncbi:putative nucleotide-diphospho-sugar transferase [Achromobacter xylosoxidans]
MGMTVAFFTRDSIYETEKNRLVRSAERLQLPVDAQAIDTTGSWVRNAAMKPGVLVGMRRKHRGPMLYVDVDAVFHRNPWPSLGALDCDIAAYHEPDGHLLSGTLYINDTPAAATLLDEWAAACGANPDEWDQLVLERILAEDAARAEPRYRQARLPVAYCWIFDKIDNAASAQVYIEHLQASRESQQLKGLFRKPVPQRATPPRPDPDDREDSVHGPTGPLAGGMLPRLRFVDVLLVLVQDAVALHGQRIEQLVQRQGALEVPALHLGNAVRGHLVDVFLGFRAFRDHFDIEGLGQLDDLHRHRALGASFGEPLREDLVELQVIHRKRPR